MSPILHKLLMSLPLVATSLVFAAPDAGAEIAWESDLRTARDRAEREGKLLLLHFYSDSCGWCDRLEAGAFKSPEVAAAIEQSYVPVKIHAGQNPNVARTFRINGYPTDVIVTPAGTALSHRTSPQAANRYVEMLAESAASPNRGPVVDPAAVAAAPATPPATTPATDAPPAMAAQPPVADQPTAPSEAVVAAAVPSLGVSPISTIPGTTSDLAKSSFTPSSLAMPGPSTSLADLPTAPTPPKAPAAAASAVASHPIALEGYCPVSLLDHDKWVEGNPQHGVVHLGQLYLFANAESAKKFLADPEPYTPVLNGIDVVRFFEEKRIVAGKRDFGARDPEHNRMFFFADEAAMIHFEEQHTRYTEAAIRVTRQAVAEANPRR